MITPPNPSRPFALLIITSPPFDPAPLDNSSIPPEDSFEEESPDRKDIDDPEGALLIPFAMTIDPAVPRRLLPVIKSTEPDEVAKELPVTSFIEPDIILSDTAVVSIVVANTPRAFSVPPLFELLLNPA
jgi:hypothetical protein